MVNSLQTLCCPRIQTLKSLFLSVPDLRNYKNNGSGKNWTKVFGEVFTGAGENAVEFFAGRNSTGLQALSLSH
jgi:hypothetical protein